MGGEDFLIPIPPKIGWMNEVMFLSGHLVGGSFDALLYVTCGGRRHVWSGNRKVCLFVRTVHTAAVPWCMSLVVTPRVALFVRNGETFPQKN